MPKRRMHITEDEGNTIIIALMAGIEEVKKIIQVEPTFYWKTLLEKMNTIYDKLKSYKWDK